MPQTVTADAPVRVCDLGGWTDTWFAAHGLVVNIAVRPGVTASVARHRRGSRPDRVTIEAPDLHGGPDELLWAVVEQVGAQVDADLEIVVRSAVPAGAAMGTSAAVTVALLAALGDTTAPADLARLAHAVEAGRLGRESGVQDQVAAAHGGVNRIEIGLYPATRVTRLPVPPGLAAGLRTVYLGSPHDSSAVHRRVIEILAGAGPDAEPLERLRRAAAAGADALVAGDLGAFGRAMVANTDAQADLAPGVVGTDALAVIDVAGAHRALGWKVNGAGGGGGTVTVLLDPAGEPSGQRFEAAVAEAGWRILPVTVSQAGVVVRSNT